MKKQQKSAGDRSNQGNNVRFQLDENENQKSSNQQSLNTVKEEKSKKRENKYDDDSEDDDEFNSSSMIGDGTSTIDFHRLTNKKKQYL